MKAIRTTKKVKRLESRTALAGAIGVGRTTLNRILAKPGAPVKGRAGWDVLECTAWVKENLTTELRSSDGTPRMAKAKLEEFEIRLRRALREEQIELGDLIRLSDLKQEIGAVVEKIKVALMALPTQWGARVGAIGPEIEQMTKADISETLRTLADDLCGVVK